MFQLIYLQAECYTCQKGLDIYFVRTGNQKTSVGSEMQYLSQSMHKQQTQTDELNSFGLAL